MIPAASHYYGPAGTQVVAVFLIFVGLFWLGIAIACFVSAWRNRGK